MKRALEHVHIPNAISGNMCTFTELLIFSIAFHNFGREDQKTANVDILFIHPSSHTRR